VEAVNSILEDLRKGWLMDVIDKRKENRVAWVSVERQERCPAVSTRAVCTRLHSNDAKGGLIGRVQHELPPDG